jgi:predicted dehydrogenase
MNIEANVKTMKVVVVGLGKAAWLYAFQGQNKFRTHTYSILNNPKFRLVAGVETNQEIRDKWTKSIGINSYATIEDIPSNIRFDLVVICTCQESLLTILLHTLSTYPTVKILIEKPIVKTTEDILKIEAIDRSDVDRIVVNFPRLFLPENDVIKSLLDDGMKESEYKISGNYSKGFLNTGTHVITLINNWFPETEFKVYEFYETFKSDMGLSFNLVSSNFLMNDKSRIAYNSLESDSTFDLIINNSTSKLEYMDGGDSISYNNYLSNKVLSIRSNRREYQKYVYDTIAQQEWDFIVSISGLANFIPIIKKILNQNKKWA